MIEIGALLLVVSIVGVWMIPDDKLDFKKGASPWFDAAAFALVTASVTGVFLVVVGLIRAFAVWLGAW